MKYSKEIEDEMTELFYKKAVENTIKDLERYFLDTNLCELLGN